MAVTTKDVIRGWFQEGLNKKAAKMLIFCDKWSWDDFPVFVNEPTAVTHTIKRILGANRHAFILMEVYDLRRDMEKQLATLRVYDYSLVGSPTTASQP